MSLTFKIKLDGSAKPPIWRKIKMNSSDTFSKLHLAIQGAFGWQEYHLWQFADTGVPRTVVQEPDEELDWDDAFMEDFLPTGRPDVYRRQRHVSTGRLRRHLGLLSTNRNTGRT